MRLTVNLWCRIGLHTSLLACALRANLRLSKTVPDRFMHMPRTTRCKTAPTRSVCIQKKQATRGKGNKLLD